MGEKRLSSSDFNTLHRARDLLRLLDRGQPGGMMQWQIDGNWVVGSDDAFAAFKLMEKTIIELGDYFGNAMVAINPGTVKYCIDKYRRWKRANLDNPAHP